MAPVPTLFEQLESWSMRPTSCLTQRTGPVSDPRNGLPLCGTHHTALDCDLIAIDPVTTRVVITDGHDATSLGIQRVDLTHLHAQPAQEAPQYRWEHRSRVART